MSGAPGAQRAPALRRHYAKLCCLEDFDDPALLEAIADVVPERDALEHIERKVWEFAMLVLFLRETGHLDDRARVLATGAGDERGWPTASGTCWPPTSMASARSPSARPAT